MKNLVFLTAMLVMVVAVGVSVAVAQTEPVAYVGYITSISGDSVLVEEDPQDPVSDGADSIKGYFTVTGETEFFRLVGGDAVGPATFEELQVGQLVSATYSGPVLESYPRREEPAASQSWPNPERSPCAISPRAVIPSGTARRRMLRAPCSTPPER